jgi:hypothetical protein
VEQNQAAIEGVVTEFGGQWAKSLELLATIVYVERDAKSAEVKLPVEQIADIVHDLKPHFSMAEIREAIEGLVRKNYIEVLRPAMAR